TARRQDEDGLVFVDVGRSGNIERRAPDVVGGLCDGHVNGGHSWALVAHLVDSDHPGISQTGCVFETETQGRVGALLEAAVGGEERTEFHRSARAVRSTCRLPACGADPPRGCCASEWARSTR